MVVPKKLANKEYVYNIYTSGTKRTCKVCNLWVHDYCSFNFMSDDNKCVSCCPHDPSFKIPRKRRQADEKTSQNISMSRNDIETWTTGITAPTIYGGFENPVTTNTCWLNSALQVLLGLPIFSKFVEVFEKGDSDLTDSFFDILKEWKTNSKAYISCQQFK